MTYGFCSVLQFGSAAYATSFLDRQDHIFETLILEITKLNIYLLVIYTIKRNEMNCEW